MCICDVCVCVCTFSCTAVLVAAGNTRYALYTFRSMTKRLRTPGNGWLIVVKTLMVFHRCIRDGGKTSRQGLLQHLNENTGAFDCSNFKDDSNKDAWERGAWARNYAAYLEERLHTLRALGYERDEACTGESTVMRSLDTPTLLKHLDNLQTLLRKLLNTKPQNKVVTESPVIVGAIACIVRESFKIYQTCQDGIINLVDRFFEMEYLEAKKAFETYKLSIKQTEALSVFYRAIQDVPSMSTIDLPSMEKPPDSFLRTMEEYLQNAPGRTTSVASPGRTRSMSGAGSSSKPRSYSEAQPPSGSSGMLLEVPLPERSGSVGSPPDGNSQIGGIILENAASPLNSDLAGLEALVSPSEVRTTTQPSATPTTVTPAVTTTTSASPPMPAAAMTTPTVAAPAMAGGGSTSEPNLFGSLEGFGAAGPGSASSNGPIGSSGSVGGPSFTDSPGGVVVDSSSSSGPISKNALDHLYNEAIINQNASAMVNVTRMHDPTFFSTQPTVPLGYMGQPMTQQQQQQWNVNMQQMNMQMQQMGVQPQMQPQMQSQVQVAPQQANQTSPPRATQPNLL